MRKLTPLLLGIAALAAAGCNLEPDRVPARVQLTVAALEDAPDEGAFDPAPICAGDAAYCTPSNLSGRIYKAVALWGELGPGARSITLLDGTGGHVDDNDYMGGTLPFSLIDGEIVTSSYEAVEGGGSRPITRLEFYYDFVDATVALAGPLAAGDPAAAWQVRTVFVTEAQAADVAGTMQRGDKLVRGPGETSWRWCNAQGCSPDRAAVATDLIAEAKLVDRIHPGQGPVHYVPFTVPLDPPLSLTAGEINTAESLWSAAFDMTDAILLHAAPDAIDSPQALLAAFELAYEPDQQHAGQEVRISARLDFTRGPDPVVAGEPPAACVTACARVANCYGFDDGVFGADEPDCTDSCGAQPDAMISQVTQCVASADCADRSALAACLPSGSDAP